MIRRVAVPAFASLALVAPLPAGALRGAAPTIEITACKAVVLVSGAGANYYRCTGVYASGVPHAAKRFALLVRNRGFPTGSRFQLRFLDDKTRQQLASPLTLGPVDYDPGLWKVTF